ncbi:redoxin domain-containing protein [bacterium]|nr:MAG: redoxin domain-containing protein [bacterium]
MLSVAGLGIAYMAWSAPRNVPGLIESTEVRHHVTAPMEAATDARSRKAAPVLALTTYDGHSVTLGGPSERPRFVYFVKEGCPCSFDAEPLFRDLYRHLDKKVDFIAVTDAEPKAARKWATEMSVAWPLVSDHKAHAMREYGAVSSVYGALLDREGRIVKMWPGYSQGFLQEMNRLMSETAGIPETPFDTKYAPKEKATGCAFAYLR